MVEAKTASARARPGSVRTSWSTAVWPPRAALTIPTIGLLVSSFRKALRHSDLRLVEYPAAPGMDADWSSSPTTASTARL